MLYVFSCSTSLTSKGLRLDTFNQTKQFHHLQHLPDFKGIETRTCLYCAWRSLLQHLPDFKGIETTWRITSPLGNACSTSLTSKGLRRHRCSSKLLYYLQHLPDFKGIETSEDLLARAASLQHLPDFKGIETKAKWPLLTVVLAAPP